MAGNDTARDILVVIGQLDVGGAERHLLKVLPRLGAWGFRVRVLLLRRGGTLVEDMQRQGVPVICPRSSMRGVVGLSVSALFLMQTLWRDRPGIIHFFLPESYLVGGLCSLLFGSVVRVMSRRSLNDYQSRRPLFSRIERRLHHSLDAALANSRAIAMQLLDEGIATHRIGLIYNGIDVASYEPGGRKSELRAQLGIPADAFVVAAVANLIAYKGHEDLLNALRHVARQLPQPWLLLCVGRDDGIGSRLRDQVRTLSLERNVRWLGERRDVDRILGAADIGVLASHEEGFSNSILEGMVALLPMVVTAVGGNAEAVVDGVTGYTVPPRASHALGDAILALAHSPDLRRSFGAAGRIRALSKFSLDTCIARYTRFYEGIGNQLSTVDCILSPFKLEDEPLVSVVVPTFNSSRTIRRALMSVLEQNYANLELIVVDDSSEDDTVAQIRSISDTRLRLKNHAHNRGVSAARNTGIALARGKYIAFLDSDDEWRADKLSVQISYMEGRPEPPAATCSGFVLRRHPSKSGVIRSPKTARHGLDQLLDVCSVSPGSTLVVLRDVFADIGCFDENLARFEGWDFLLRLLERYSFTVIPTVLAEVHIRDEAQPLQVLDTAARALFERQAKRVQRVCGRGAAACLRASLCIEMALARVYRHDYGAAVALLGRAAMYSPLRLLRLGIRALVKLAQADY